MDFENAGDTVDDNAMRTDQPSQFVVGGTSAELMSKKNMTRLRKKAMARYLRRQALPLSSFYGEGKKHNGRRMANRIACKVYESNLKITLAQITLAQLKDGTMSNSPENETRVTSEERFSPRSHDKTEQKKPITPFDQSPPCNTLFIGDLSLNNPQYELKSLFLRFGYTLICFLPKQNDLMCFIEFEDTQAATRALKYCQGYPLVDGTKKGIILEYSRIPLPTKYGNVHTAASEILPHWEDHRKLVDCACGDARKEQYMFQCIKCSGWQHISCYHGVVQSEGEIHECVNCSSKQHGERTTEDIYQSRKRKFEWAIADEPDAFRKHDSMASVQKDHTDGILTTPWYDPVQRQWELGKITSQPVSKFGTVRIEGKKRVPDGEMTLDPIPDDSHMTEKRVESLLQHMKPESKENEETTEVVCPCGCAALNDAHGHILPQLNVVIEEDWTQVQGQLPDDWRWDTEYDNECWTCTPLESNEPKPYPLTIAGAPVILPVEYQWPPMGGVNPPPDPRPSNLIDCRASMPLDALRDLFLTFEGSLGFYILINGLIQIIVPQNFDTTWASSHLPHKYGGLKVCYIPHNIEPTMQLSTTQIADTNPDILSSTSDSVNRNWLERSLHNSRSDSLKLNDFVEVKPKSKSRKEKFSGRIGLKVIKNGSPYLAMSTHVITEAILAKSRLESIFGGTQTRIEKLTDNWNEHVEVWAGNEKIGTISKSFDTRVETYPNGFNHDVTLIRATTSSSIRDITSPIPDIGWLNRDSWNSLRQQTSKVKILAPTENHRAAKSVKCSRLSDILIVGEGIFLNQTAALGGSKSLKDHDASTWRDLVSRAVLYRVFPDFDPPNGYSGVALYADGTREDGTQGPGIVGFQSFIQRSGHVQNFGMEGAPLEQRLKLGRVAFYGAFEVPAELKSYTIV